MIEKNIMSVVCEISQWLILRKVDWIYCGWTADYSLYYKMKINNCTVYLEVFFSKSGNTTALSIFKDKNLIPFNGDTFKDYLDEIEKICYAAK